MKLDIEKLPTGKIRLELATDTKTKPLVLELDAQQLRALLETAAVAQRSSVFKFSLTL